MRTTKKPLTSSILLFVFIVYLVFIPHRVQAATTNITVSADATVLWDTPNTNYGSVNYNSIYLVPSYYNYQFWLKFSLSSLPSGVAISSAEIYLYCYYLTGSSSLNVATHFSSDDSWTEAGITWNNQPSYGETETSVNVNSEGAWFYWTVTSKIQQEYAGDKTASFHFSTSENERVRDFRSKEYGSLQPYLKVTYSYYPVNDSLELTNPSIATQGCLAQKQAYIFRAKVTDNDGGTNILYVAMTLDWGSGQNLAFRWMESTDTFSEVNDPYGYVSISSTSADSTLSGNQWTLDFKITFAWTYPDESLHNVRLETHDDNTLIDYDLYSNVYYVENDLVSSGRAVNDYRVNPSQSLTFSGTVYYEGTVISPPDGDYSVSVKLGGVPKATDSTLVSGAFSASANAETTVGSYTYNVDFSYETGSDTFTAVIVDAIQVTISANSTNPTNSQKTQLTTTATYQYDSTSVTTLSFQMTRNGSNFSTSSPVVDGAYTDTAYIYTISSASETAYGLNTFSTNNIMVRWGANLFIEIYDSSFPDLRVDVNGLAFGYFRGRFSNNMSAVSSGTLYYKLGVTGTQVSTTFNSTGWARLNGTKSSVTQSYFLVTAVNVNGETDIYASAWSQWIVWDRLELVSVAASNTHVNMSGTFELRYVIRYDSDNVPFTSSKGSVSGFSFDAVNGWWEKTVTASSSAISTNYNETYVSVSDTTYGLTVKSSSGVNVITDGLNISQSLDLDAQILYLRLTYAYNGSAISGGSVYFAGSTFITNSTGWANYTLSSLNDFTWGQIAYGVSDVAYGITYKAQNQTIPLQKLGVFFINTQASHTVSLTQFQGYTLSFSVSGTGATTIKVYYTGSLILYYVKINGMVKVEGDSWTKSSGLVTITDTLASTHTYVVSFQPLGGTPTGSSSPTTEKIDESVEAAKEIVYRLASNWISVLMLIGLVVATVVAYVKESDAWKYLAVAVGVLSVNFLLVFVVIPQGWLPRDLAFLERFTFKPAALELSTLPIATQSILQIAVMGFLLVSIMGSVAVLALRGEE